MIGADQLVLSRCRIVFAPLILRCGCMVQVLGLVVVVVGVVVVVVGVVVVVVRGLTLRAAK